MSIDEKKVHLIEALLKVRNDAVLNEIDSILRNYQQKRSPEHSLRNLAGAISKAEADEMKKAIDDACETIDENDWK